MLAARSSNAAVTDMDYRDKLELILNYLNLYSLEDIEEDSLGDIIGKGLMENIGDKYAQYYTAQEFDQLIDDMNGSYAGIGVQIVMNDDGLIEVYRVFAGSPAEEAGVQIKDCIVEANGVRDFADMDSLVSIVRGEEGTTVDIVVLRDEEEIPMTIERRAIVSDSVYSMMLYDTIGYIAIYEFNTATVQQFNEALDSLFEQGMTSVVMDLRDNPGGDYDSIVAICDRVLPEGVIVTVEDKLGGMHTENSDATCLDIPIVLLVNENTASAAELFTMALHDYGMAQIVGTRTFGKGVVQSIFRLLDGSGLKFTTEKYYGPAGNWIQDTGIEPDCEVEIPDEAYEDGRIDVEEDLQLRKALELLGVDYDMFVEEYYETWGDEAEAGTEIEIETEETETSDGEY